MKDILRKNVEASVVYKYYEANKKLDKSTRSILTEVVVREMMQQCLSLRSEDFILATEKIVEEFPTEQKEVYFLPCKGRQQNVSKGKLPDKYRNKRRLLTRTHQGVVATSQKHDEIEISRLVIDDKIWLKHHTEPWETVVEKWKNTYIMRSTTKYSSLAEVLEQWPSLKKANSPLLIEEDFKLLYPGKENHMLDNWNVLREQLIAELLRSLTFQAYELKSNFKCQNNKDAVMFNFLHLMCPPTMVRVPLTKKSWRPATNDSRKAFILHVKKHDEIEEQLSERRHKLDTLGFPQHPIILMVGETLRSLQSFYVCVNEVHYKLETLVKAVDLCYKAFQVFHVSYPPECYQIWLLIQRFVYETETKYDKPTPSVTSLMSDLRQKWEL